MSYCSVMVNGNEFIYNKYVGFDNEVLLKDLDVEEMCPYELNCEGCLSSREECVNMLRYRDMIASGQV